MHILTNLGCIATLSHARKEEVSPGTRLLVVCHGFARRNVWKYVVKCTSLLKEGTEYIDKAFPKTDIRWLCGKPE